MALPKKGFNDFSQSAASGAAVPECGGDMALALTSTVQGQANQMVIAAQAAQVSIDHASTQMADYFTRVMSGQELLNATLAKTQANLESMGGPIHINTEVQPITLNLPSTGDFNATRQRFRGLFNSTPDIDPSYILSAPADLADGEHDD